MKRTWRRLACVSAIVAASWAQTNLAAEETAEGKACAQLLPAIEDLKAMLASESKARSADNETQRMQILMNLLGLRYHNIEALESNLRSIDSQEDDIRGALARGQAQLEAIDDAARNSTAAVPDPERKSQRVEVQINVKALEEQIKTLGERRANSQARLALDRHDIDKLESLIQGWLEKSTSGH